MGKLILLDTTLRDGGLGLEDNYIKKYSNKTYTKEQINDITNHLSQSKIEIIELGSIEISKEDKTCFAIYQNIEEISKTIDASKHTHAKFAALYRGPDTPIENIPNWNPSLCEIVRVIIRYSELEKSINFCSELAKKGYKVCIQPMLTMRYTEEELLYILKEANKMNAFAVYIVDSYGYMLEKDILNLANLYQKNLNENIKIGLHAHNNMNFAFGNTLSFIKAISKHDIIIDSCVMGLGQGAGNLQTEIIVNYLNEHNNKNYNFNKILSIAEIISQFFNENLCGYSITCLLPAIHKTAYKYALDMRLKYKLSFIEINQRLSIIPESIKHRYTPENLEILLLQQL